MMGTIIILALGLMGIAIVFYLLIYEPNPWSHWMPTIENGEPGFSRFKTELGISDDLMRSDPQILIRTKQFIPLTQFFGKGFKPVTLKQWEKLHAKRKPYKWRVTSEQLERWMRKQTK